jgi:hypothetical protein
VAIAVPGAWTARGERLVREVLEPTAPALLTGIVLKVQLMILLAAAADQIQVVGIARIVRKENGGLTQEVIPQVRVEFPIAEMVCVFEKAPDRGEKIDHLPELIRQLELVKEDGGGKGHAFAQQQLEEDNRLRRLKFDDFPPEDLFQFRGEVGGLSPQHRAAADGGRLATKSLDPLSLVARSQGEVGIEGRGDPFDHLAMEAGRLVRQVRRGVSARGIAVKRARGRVSASLRVGISWRLVFVPGGHGIDLSFNLIQSHSILLNLFDSFISEPP